MRKNKLDAGYRPREQEQALFGLAVVALLKGVGQDGGGIGGEQFSVNSGGLAVILLGMLDARCPLTGVEFEAK